MSYFSYPLSINQKKTSSDTKVSPTLVVKTGRMSQQF